MMATSLIDFDVEPESGERSGEKCSEARVLEKCTIDLEIERQLNELLKVKRSTGSSSTSTTFPSTTTCLLDLDEFGESVQQKDSTSGQLISNDVSVKHSVTPDKPVVTLDKLLVNIGVTPDKLVNNCVSSDSRNQKTVLKHENPSTNGFELLASELKNNAIVIPEKSTGCTQPKETVIVYSNPVSLMFEYASKQRLKNPCFIKERLDNAFKVTCLFAGVQGEGIGRSVKIAKIQSAEDCLKKFNTAMLNNQPIDLKFKKEPDIVIKNSNNKPSNAIGELYEHAAKFLNERPQFESSESVGRTRVYTVTCSYLSYRESSTDKSKQKAKTEAAFKVYEKLVNAIN